MSEKERIRVGINENTKNRLYGHKRVGDTWDDVITRLMDQYEYDRLNEREDE